MRAFLALACASAIYGFSLGSAHSWLYAQRNLVKFPLLITGTGLVCGLCYWVAARFIGARLSRRDVSELTVTMFRDTAILLASLSPVTFFLGRVLVYEDDGRLGEYGLFLGLNVCFIAVCGALALVRQGRRLLVRAAVSSPRATTIVLTWLVVSLFVGGQAAWYLRPIFGLPASRGQVPPFALGSTPDVRGATNFYEAMLQIFERPALPRRWR